MKLPRLTRQILTASCLSVLVSCHAIAVDQLQQPRSVDSLAGISLTSTTSMADPAVTPASCCDSECDKCCDGGAGCCGKGKSCCSSSCCCEAVCCPKRVTEEVKKHCWLVKPELVCIPGFRFECNWGKSKCSKKGGCDRCCDDLCCGDGCCENGTCCCNDPGKPTCGRVRCINVLEKHEFKCEECGYEWEVKCVRSGKRRSCCGKRGCNCPSCGCASNDFDETNQPERQTHGVQLTTALEASNAPQDSQQEISMTQRFTKWLLKTK